MECPFLGFDVVLCLCKILTLGEAGGRVTESSLYISLQPPCESIIIYKKKLKINIKALWPGESTVMLVSAVQHGPVHQEAYADGH